MAGHSLVVLGWSWTDLSVLSSQLFGQASAESCAKSQVVSRSWSFMPIFRPGWSPLPAWSTSSLSSSSNWLSRDHKGELQARYKYWMNAYSFLGSYMKDTNIEWLCINFFFRQQHPSQGHQFPEPEHDWLSLHDGWKCPTDGQGPSAKCCQDILQHAPHHGRYCKY